MEIQLSIENRELPIIVSISVLKKTGNKRAADFNTALKETRLRLPFCFTIGGYEARGGSDALPLETGR